MEGKRGAAMYSVEGRMLFVLFLLGVAMQSGDGVLSFFVARAMGHETAAFAGMVVLFLRAPWVLRGIVGYLNDHLSFSNARFSHYVKIGAGVLTVLWIIMIITLPQSFPGIVMHPGANASTNGTANATTAPATTTTPGGNGTDGSGSGGGSGGDDAPENREDVLLSLVSGAGADAMTLVALSWVVAFALVVCAGSLDGMTTVLAMAQTPSQQGEIQTKAFFTRAGGETVGMVLVVVWAQMNWGETSSTHDPSAFAACSIALAVAFVLFFASFLLVDPDGRVGTAAPPSSSSSSPPSERAARGVEMTPTVSAASRARRGGGGGGGSSEERGGGVVRAASPRVNPRLCTPCRPRFPVLRMMFSTPYMMLLAAIFLTSVVPVSDVVQSSIEMGMLHISQESVVVLRVLQGLGSLVAAGIYMLYRRSPHHRRVLYSALFNLGLSLTMVVVQTRFPSSDATYAAAFWRLFVGFSTSIMFLPNLAEIMEQAPVSLGRESTWTNLMISASDLAVGIGSIGMSHMLLSFAGSNDMSYVTAFIGVYFFIPAAVVWVSHLCGWAATKHATVMYMRAGGAADSAAFDEEENAALAERHGEL